MEALKGGKTNPIQREIDSNVAIATFEFLSASKLSRRKTNFFKLSFAPLPYPFIFCFCCA
jgi:hypothetical protein